MSAPSSMPEKIGSFKIIQRLGTAGFSEVFLAEDTHPKYRGDRVTIRRVRPELIERDPLYRQALMAECQIGRLFHHGNLIQVYDLIDQDGIPYLVTEYVDGVLLSQMVELNRGPLEPGVTAEIARQLCDALWTVHQAVDTSGTPLGIVHQDIRPSNISITQRGDVKLLETGIARSKVMGHGGAKVKRESTPYDSPEQTRNEPYLTPASDQYSVGVIVFEMLSGIPFHAELEALARRGEQRVEALNILPDTEDSVIVKLDDMMIDDLADATVSFDALPPMGREARQDWGRRQFSKHLKELEQLPGAGLDEILGQMLAYDPKDRFATTREAGEELLRWAWGMVGQGKDYRGFVEAMFAKSRGLEPVSRKTTLVTAPQVVEEAANSPFLPPRNQANETPRTGSRTFSLTSDDLNDDDLEPEGAAYPAPGSLMDDDVGASDGEPSPQALEAAQKEFQTRTDPQVKMLNEAKPSLLKRIASIQVPPRIALIVGSGALAVGLTIGLVWAVRPPPDQRPKKAAMAEIEPDAPSPAVVPAAKEIGLQQMLANSQGDGDSSAFRGLRGSDGTTGTPSGTSSRTPSQTSDATPKAPSPSTKVAASRPPDDRSTSMVQLEADIVRHPLPPEPFKPFVGKSLPGSGFLTIATSPPGAMVILDGLSIEESPITFDSITAGEHQVILRSDELGQRHVRTVRIKAGQHWRGTWSFRERRWVLSE